MTITSDGVVGKLGVAVVAAARPVAERFAEMLREHYDVRTMNARDGAPIATPMSSDIWLVDISNADAATVTALSQNAIGGRGSLIVFTTTRDSAAGIAALDAGADELLTTTMPPEEVVSRVRAAVRRRTNAPDTAAQAPVAAALQGGPIVVDLEQRRVEIDGKLVHLTALELKLLAYFLIHAEEPISRARLMDAVWGYSIGNVATVTVHVRRLREKIERDPSNPRLIRTVWGLGYQFSPCAT